MTAVTSQKIKFLTLHRNPNTYPIRKRTAATNPIRRRTIKLKHTALQQASLQIFVLQDNGIFFKLYKQSVWPRISRRTKCFCCHEKVVNHPPSNERSFQGKCDIGVQLHFK